VLWISRAQILRLQYSNIFSLSQCNLNSRSVSCDSASETGFGIHQYMLISHVSLTTTHSILVLHVRETLKYYIRPSLQRKKCSRQSNSNYGTSYFVVCLVIHCPIWTMNCGQYVLCICVIQGAHAQLVRTYIRRDYKT
jgi:hypothetical protein